MSTLFTEGGETPQVYPVSKEIHHPYGKDGRRYRMEIIRGDGGYSLDELRSRAFDTYRQVHFLDPIQTYREITSIIRGEGSLFFFSVENEANIVDIGLVAQRIMMAEVNGVRYRALYMSTKAFLQDHQNNGLGTYSFEQSRTIHRPRFMVGRSPNPYLFLALEDLEEVKGRVTPIDDDYVKGSLKYSIAKFVTERTGNPRLEDNGVTRRVYPEGRSKAFIIDETNGRVMRIVNRIQELGANVDDGDGVVYAVDLEEWLTHSPAITV